MNFPIFVFKENFMKHIIAFLLLLSLSPLYSQTNPNVLNGYKVAYVAELEYSGGKKDIYGLSYQTQVFFQKLGFIVVTADTANKYALNNPCETIYITANNGKRSKVYFDIKNCKDEIIYQDKGHSANWNNNYRDNFRRSLDIVFKKFKNYKLAFNENLTPKLEIEVQKYEKEDIDFSDMESIRNYLSSKRLDQVEGIWNTASNSSGDYKVLIIKGKFNYYAYVIESNTWWNKSELKAIIEPTASNTIFTINWIMGDKTTKVKSLANLEGALMKFQINNNELALYKVFPSLNNTSTKSTINQQNWAANGSGIIISKSGYIVTNYHVIKNTQDVEVEFLQDGEVNSFNAEIIQTDKVNDLAILKIVDVNFDGVSNLPYNFKTRSSDVGTKVYAYGYPMALTVMGKEIKITDGIISSKSGYDGDITTYQITAPIQGGNSGGPLFDDKGNFLGINSSGLRKDFADNVGYTIKSSYVLNLIDVLPKNIDLPSSTKLKSLPLTEQIKEISKYVVLVKVK